MDIRTAVESDALAMGKLMVETYLRAHKGQIPDEVWQKRLDEWTWEVSARGWHTAIQDITNGSSPEECIFLSVKHEHVKSEEKIAGVIMGGPAEVGPWQAGGEIYALYVHYDFHRQGIGRALVRAAVRHLRTSGLLSLVIRSVPANEAANRFYEALGGQIVGYCETQEYGLPIPQRIYGWHDSVSLLEDEAG